MQPRSSKPYQISVYLGFRRTFFGKGGDGEIGDTVLKIGCCLVYLLSKNVHAIVLVVFLSLKTEGPVEVPGNTIEHN